MGPLLRGRAGALDGVDIVGVGRSVVRAPGGGTRRHGPAKGAEGVVGDGQERGGLPAADGPGQDFIEGMTGGGNTLGVGREMDEEVVQMAAAAFVFIPGDLWLEC